MKGAHSGAIKSRTQGLSAVPGGAGRGFARKAARPAEHFDLNVGERLGDDLMITKQLSPGPFTEIYQVWSASRLCFFACKVLRAHVARTSAQARHLIIERAILKRLSHPNIVRVYESDETAELPHVVLDYLPGPSLFARLAASPRRRLPIPEALKIAIYVGGALEHLHSFSYLYRDLKPANVLFREDLPVMIDFGSVYHYRPGRAARTRVGTDPYMAPEQCLGEPLSPATDVFGLGAVLYEMLTGEWPYEDQLMNVFDRTRLENRFPQIKHSPGRLRRRTPSVGPELEAVVLRCLARDPEDRFASVAELVAELGAFVKAEEIVPGAAA
jgi:serine/threonine protein kinase